MPKHRAHRYRSSMNLVPVVRSVVHGNAARCRGIDRDQTLHSAQLRDYQVALCAVLSVMKNNMSGICLALTHNRADLLERLICRPSSAAEAIHTERSFA